MRFPSVCEWIYDAQPSTGDRLQARYVSSVGLDISHPYSSRMPSLPSLACAQRHSRSTAHSGPHKLLNIPLAFAHKPPVITVAHELPIVGVAHDLPTI